MATPFTIFRKHQKAGLAAVGILCMIAFSVGAVTSQMDFGGYSSPADRTIVTTKYGPLRESDLLRLGGRRTLANNYVQHVVEYASGRRFNEPLNYFGRSTEGQLVDNFLMIKQAEALGIRISNERVVDFVTNVVNDQLKPEAYQQITRGLRATENQVLDALRAELMALMVDRFHGNSSSSTLAELSLGYSSIATPAELWGYYRKLNVRASLEALPLPVEQFAAGVETPSDSVVREFFESHKLAEPSPNLPQPGFKIPAKVSLVYAKADFRAFEERAKQSITDDEIRKKYFEDRESFYVRPEFNRPQSGPGGTPDSDEPEPETDGPALAPAAGGDTQGANKGSESSDNKTGAPSDTPPSSESKSNPEESKGDKSTPASDDSSWMKVPQDVLARLVSLTTPWATLAGLQESAEEPDSELQATDAAQTDLRERATSNADEAEAEKAADSPDEAENNIGSAGDVEESTAKVDGNVEVPTTDTAAATEPAESETPPAKAIESTTSAELPESSSTTSRPIPPRVESPPEIGSELLLPPADIEDLVFFTLSEVGNSIRDELAFEKAGDLINKALNRVSERVNRHGRRLDEYLADPTSGKEPVLSDVNTLATDNGLAYADVGLVTAYEANQIAGLGEAVFRDSQKQNEFESFGEHVFAMHSFTPERTSDPLNNRYTFWVTDNQPARVPELDEVRDEVIGTWKLVEARKLVDQRANVLVERLQDSNVTIAELATETEKETVLNVPGFSWWTTTRTAGHGTRGGLPEISEVPGIVKPGDDFMQAVFTRAKGQAGFAFNQPQTVGFVFRVKSVEPTEAIAHAKFMAESSYTMQAAAQPDAQAAANAWLEELRQDAQLHWERPADGDFTQVK